MQKKTVFTIKELSEILQIDRSTLTRNVNKIFHDKMKHGVTTQLNEAEITILKKHLESSDFNSCKVARVKTELDKKLIIAQAMQYLNEEIEELTFENSRLKDDIQLLTHTERTYTAGQIAKELNLKSAQELNKILQAEKIIYKKGGSYLPYSNYADCGYMNIKQEIVNGIEIYHSKWTQKGREFILKKLSNKAVAKCKQ